MSEKLKRVILVPWDFTESSQKALAHAYQLAQMVGDDVMLVRFIRRPLVLASAAAKDRLHSRELEEQEKLDAEADKLSRQFEVQREELRKSLETEAYQERQVHEVTIIPYVLTYRNIRKELALLYQSMSVNLVVTTSLYQLDGGRSLNLMRTLSRVKSGRLSTVPFILVKNFPTHRYYTDVVLPLNFYKNFRESIRWVAFLSNYYHCNVNIIKAAARNNEMKKGLASNTYFTKKILDAFNVVYGIKNANKDKPFRHEVENFVKEIDADIVLVMTDRMKQLFPDGEIKLDVPVMFINPLAKLQAGFN